MIGAKKLKKAIYYDLGSCYESKELIELDYFIEVGNSLINFYSKNDKKKLPLEIIIFSSISNLDMPLTRLNYSSSCSSRKKKILFIISCENGYDSRKISKYYDVIFQSYLEKNDIKNNIFPIPVGIPNFKVLNNKKKKNLLEKKFRFFFLENLNKQKVVLFSEIFSLNILLKNIIKLMIKCKLNKILGFVIKKISLNYYDSNKKIFFTNQFNSGLGKIKYLEYLSKSKFALCPKGFLSTETFRHYEAAAFGAIAISQKLPNNWIYKKFPYIQVRKWNKLDLLIKKHKRLNSKRSFNWYMNTIDPRGASKNLLNFIKRYS